MNLHPATRGHPSMQRLRFAPMNLPIEIVRTLVAINDTGSFTKAGEKLGLSQPAISAQVKRLQTLVGGPVFARTAGGVILTDRGHRILPHARRLLQANDQILLAGGTRCDGQTIRVGISRWYVQRFLARLDRSVRGNVHVVVGDTATIQKGLTEGYIDVGAIVDPLPESGTLLAQWEMEVAWVRSRHFTLSPGAPVPLVHWPSFTVDQLAIEALQAKGMAYRVVFESADSLCRMQAISSGIGVAPWPRQEVQDGLVVAREYYLPPLPGLRAGVSARSDFDTSEAEGLISVLCSLGTETAPPEERHQA